MKALHRSLSLLTICAFLSMQPAGLFAQTTAGGTIRGHVSDPVGAAVGEASVTSDGRAG